MKEKDKFIKEGTDYFKNQVDFEYPFLYFKLLVDEWSLQFHVAYDAPEYEIVDNENMMRWHMKRFVRNNMKMDTSSLVSGYEWYPNELIFVFDLDI